MYYRINVAYKGQHYFATADHSLTNEAQARTVFGELSRKFTKEEGFEVTASRVETLGHELKWGVAKKPAYRFDLTVRGTRSRRKNQVAMFDYLKRGFDALNATAADRKYKGSLVAAAELVRGAFARYQIEAPLRFITLENTIRIADAEHFLAVVNVNEEG